MTFFETLLALLLASVVLLQVARRLSLPYPAMLAGAGVVVALVPGAPNIPIEPATALPLFIAPALVDAAYDFPPSAARRFWAPLVAFALVAVLATAALVAGIGWAYAGLPLAAAVALGAIVAPPDAAAATAVLSTVSIPRSTDAVLKGESLFNDATALLLFGAALAVQSNGGLDLGVGLRLALAVPGGLGLGVAWALVVRRIDRLVTGTLGGNLLQFVNAFLVWIVAERLHLSAVLSTVAFAMTLARSAEVSGGARMRVHSYAVWSAVVFCLNVFAFLLMGMQARGIVARMEPAALTSALVFAGLVVLAVVVARLAVVVGYNRLTAWRYARRGEPAPASLAQAVFVGWSGMRGLVTLATAFALPEDFPQRDAVVLTAFGVVLATLVLQGLTLGPLIRWLDLDQGDAFGRELAEARATLAATALATIGTRAGPEADNLRYAYALARDAAGDPSRTAPLERRRDLGLAAIAAERGRLERMRLDHAVGADAYGMLQEELDWRELALLPDDARRIEEG